MEVNIHELSNTTYRVQRLYRHDLEDTAGNPNINNHHQGHPPPY